LFSKSIKKKNKRQSTSDDAPDVSRPSAPIDVQRTVGARTPCERRQGVSAGSGALPGLLGLAVRAGDGRRDRRAEDQAARARVGGLVERPTGAAHSRDREVGDASGRLGARPRHVACVAIVARAARMAQGLGQSSSHGSCRKDPAHRKRFRPARRISSPGRPSWTTVVARSLRHGAKSGLRYWLR
jgi:hypothetical protein